MAKIIECPECCYAMDTVLIRKGGPYLPRIENYVCSSCGHTERVPSPFEYARACRKTELEIDNINIKIEKR